MEGQTLFYIGIVLMSVAALGAVAVCIAAYVSGKRLRLTLEKEFGKRRR